MSDEKVTNVFDQYRTKAKITEPPTPAPANRAYKAYLLDTTQPRRALMGIHYRDGRIGLMQKSYLLEVLLTSPQYLSLFFSNCVITLEGEQLDQLMPLLQGERILELYCFQPRLHDQPGAGEPIITSIERRSAREILEATTG